MMYKKILKQIIPYQTHLILPCNDKYRNQIVAVSSHHINFSTGHSIVSTLVNFN